MCGVCQGVGVVYSKKKIGVGINRCPVCKPTKSDLEILKQRIIDYKKLHGIA